MILIFGGAYNGKLEFVKKSMNYYKMKYFFVMMKT
ncbi:hypothetical protein B0H42_004587 [Clostridium saccharobutylicum]|nr:hypothetical protein [Clostridium saccharobutylicum]